ncbi:MAG: CoA transferase [Actinobacteria bacterium]|nr:CoA transferase [Actinomycetota bacterium]
MPMGHHDSGLLSGTAVLDFSIWRPGPYATQLLAEAGADVLKVEPPGGDPMRTYGDLFAGLHANKRSIVLDLKAPGDQARALELAGRADVVVEGYRPGVADRLGIGYEAIHAVNPSIIYCSVSGFGQSGPLRDVPGHDLNYVAWAGALAPRGGEPAEPAIPIADLAGGLSAAYAICAALVNRMRTGEGELIDVAMVEVLATWTGVVDAVADDRAPRSAGLAGYGTYRTADGNHVALGVVTEDHFWRGVCEVLALDELAALGFADRAARADELDAAIAAAIWRRERDELVAEMIAAGVPVAPVLDRAGMIALEHLRERGAVTTDPWGGLAAGHPVRFEHHPARRATPAPALDEHRGATFPRSDSGA